MLSYFTAPRFSLLLRCELSLSLSSHRCFVHFRQPIVCYQPPPISANNKNVHHLKKKLLMNNNKNTAASLFTAQFSFSNYLQFSSAADKDKSSKSPKSKKSGGKYADSLNLPHMPYALSDFKPDGRCNERENYIRKVGVLLL